MTQEELEGLLSDLAELSGDPLEFVKYAFPWGQPGELEAADGPEEWQKDILLEVKRGLSFDKAVRVAIASGRGIGKSTLLCWLNWWALSTFEDTRLVITANTEPQLATKTWPELMKWHRLFIGSQLWRPTARSIVSRDPNHPDWRIDLIPWSENNPEAFRGLHNYGKRFGYTFDEASGIAESIWEAVETSLTDKNTQKLFFAFSNPNKTKSRFAECFTRFRHRWVTRNIDSRSVRLANQEEIAEWIEDWGLESDYIKINVLGQFPAIDSESFIPWSLASEAVEREIERESGVLVLGVDPARFGDDATVIYPRKGRDAITIAPEVYYGLSVPDVAHKVLAAAHRYSASFIFVDEGGLGGGVVDILREMGTPVYGVDFGSKPDGILVQRGLKFANKRAEIWGALRDWLKVGSIPEKVPAVKASLIEELTGPQYAMNLREEIQLESKKDMRRRGVASPNVADALALTFAFPTYSMQVRPETLKPTVAPDYNPFERERIYA
jgi:hypothetical protein